METKDQAYFKRLANQLMFDVSDQEIKELQTEFEILEEQIKMLERINTDGVEEMIYPFEQETQFLRDDVVDHTIAREDALENVKAVMAGHVHVPKVVK
ncbi:MAG: Asp-tRNA(Asn)/Glu-tRNA(Gln) amidotransferase subunit GatC [Erysipelotrichaceae bacterium]|jgi:aspartyl-tRNA(Asn)/glutamyl-tRNA(Gln) amidotransferase subunit C|nr:Asp-tRNA(Asn)/Glu-tRNA(Gln) amidotransferase subunit GatC [Erysipelotrichaceae bacterium]MCI9525006.1 Asp-tRNA(Asn)/Glu-tRNA(Gln) amidotransferase subunit GatC [Erysipelotrichaceae bacterium]